MREHRASQWQAKLAAENPGNAHSATLFCLSRQKLASTPGMPVLGRAEASRSRSNSIKIAA
jgi:hypothetical protein